MNTYTPRYSVAVVLSVALHTLALWWLVGAGPSARVAEPDAAKPEDKVMLFEVVPPSPEPSPTAPPPAAPPSAPERAPRTTPPPEAPPPDAVAPAATDRPRAFMEAPPAPTGQEWALAAGYTLKNSKRYRHTWGQQVRSMMGTAFEGPDQGVVRFRIEIAPDGTLVRLQTLWTTSPKAEALARKAIDNMPPLPPTPTGLPLVFEKTIAFQPHAPDDEPYYKDDCLPDRPGFSNPYVLDGRSAQRPALPPSEQPDPQALEECLRQLPQDSLEGESAHDQRLLKQWRSDKLGR